MGEKNSNYQTTHKSLYSAAAVKNSTEAKDETEATPKRQKRPTVMKSSEETPVKLMKTLVDQNAQIIGVVSQQHDDRMAKTDRLLDILSQLVNK